jgi:predicted acylesterase/phospholipase RssA/CRP-like cAMP-binding protein
LTGSGRLAYWLARDTGRETRGEPMAATLQDGNREETRQALWRSPLCRGLVASQLDDLAMRSRAVVYPGGTAICRQGAAADRMYLVAQGRVKLMLAGAHNGCSLLEYLGPGDHFGELALLTEGPQAATAVAVTETRLLELDRRAFDDALRSLPGFAANLSRALGFRLRPDARGGTRRRRPKVVAVVHASTRTLRLTELVAEALAARGDSLHVLANHGETWPGYVGHLVERLPADGDAEGRVAAARRRVACTSEHHNRVLIDLAPNGTEREQAGIAAEADDLLWVVDAAEADAGLAALARLLAAEGALSGRVRIVWALRDPKDLAPAPTPPCGVAAPDFKVYLGQPGLPPPRNETLGVARIVRHLQGTRIGLALGGGGARGLAHLGVLRGLERAGVSFDLVAGTSSGALMGLAYAGGWAPDEALDEFCRALTPPWVLRKAPGGFHAYLVWMFRSGGWDRKLRPYVGAATLDQLHVPLSTVAVDLVTGREVVRDRGDAVNAVLESINLPPIARPIVRDGMALVDGGTLNNLPADVLPPRGADLVVGVSVASRLPGRFAGLGDGIPAPSRRAPRTLETVWRVNEVQDHGLSSPRAASVDLLIAPDTSAFEFADFTRGHGLAEAGEAAAAEAAPQLRQMLRDLERT